MSLRNRDEFERSVHSFEWIHGAAPGATDLDCVIEKNGLFLVFEGKHWEEPNGGVTVSLGQHLALTSLTKLPQFEVVLVGEATDDETHRFRTLQPYGLFAPYSRGAHRHFPSGLFTPATEDDMREIVRSWIWKAARQHG